MVTTLWLADGTCDSTIRGHHHHNIYRTIIVPTCVLASNGARSLTDECRLKGKIIFQMKDSFLISPSAAYMRQWIGSALVQIMACRLVGAKPLSKLMLGYHLLDFRNKLQWVSNQNTTFFIQEDAFENVVYEMAAVFSRRKWVKMIHKEYSWFLNQFFPTLCLYHELNMIIHTRYINIYIIIGVKLIFANFCFHCGLWSISYLIR